MVYALSMMYVYGVCKVCMVLCMRYESSMPIDLAAKAVRANR